MARCPCCSLGYRAAPTCKMAPTGLPEKGVADKAPLPARSPTANNPPKTLLSMEITSTEFHLMPEGNIVIRLRWQAPEPSRHQCRLDVRYEEAQRWRRAGGVHKRSDTATGRPSVTRGTHPRLIGCERSSPPCVPLHSPQFGAERAASP